MRVWHLFVIWEWGFFVSRRLGGNGADTGGAGNNLIRPVLLSHHFFQAEIVGVHGLEVPAWVADLLTRGVMAEPGVEPSGLSFRDKLRLFGNSM